MNKYPLVSRLIHWASALVIIFLFFSGWYMVELDYYSLWYQTLPDLHQLIGVGLLILWGYKIIRLFWVQHPHPLTTFKPSEIIAASVVKWLFYLLVIMLCISGYLMSTAGDQHALLDLLILPTILLFESDTLDILGSTHRYMAYIIMVLMLLHILAALKHHFYDKDATLRRMI